MRLSETKTDKSLEHDGQWVAIRYGAEVKVARAGNPRADAWRARLSWEDRRLLDNPDLWRGREDKVTEILTDSIAETMLLDWRGDVFTDDDDQPITYSVAKAKELLKEHEWFRDDVREAATTRETFFREEIRESGNSSRTPSAGKGSTAKS